MPGAESLANHFLIAMPNLADPNFVHSVTFICEHNENGAMGIVVNRPLDVNLNILLDHLSIECSASVDADLPVFGGGPVQTERGFVLHSPPGLWDASLAVSDGIALTTSRDILTAIAHGEGPADYLVALGYAGWGAGQLEQEITANAWLSGPMEPDILFSIPADKRWEAAAALLGVDLNLLSGDVGHA